MVFIGLVYAIVDIIRMGLVKLQGTRCIVADTA